MASERLGYHPKLSLLPVDAGQVTGVKHSRPGDGNVQGYVWENFRLSRMAFMEGVRKGMGRWIEASLGGPYRIDSVREKD